MAKAFVLILLVIGAILIESNVIPPPPSPLPASDQKLLEVYQNFSIGVTKSIADNDIAMTSETHPDLNTTTEVTNNTCLAPGIQATSAFGLGHLLAVINEKSWQVSVPVFEQLLSTTTNTLVDSYEFIFKKLLQDPDVKFSSSIFTPDELALTSGLKKLKVDVVKTDLSKGATETINNYINKFLDTPLEENYIPKVASISDAAKAVLIDTLHVAEGWSSPATKVSTPSKFNGVETVEMVEVKGTDVQVRENEKAVEVFIPFKNNRRALSLVLPNDIQEAFQSELGEPTLSNYSSVRVQLPVFKATIRNYESNLTSQCAFKKQENFFQLLDHVLVVKLSQENFEAISITGSQINNVKKFKTLKISNKAADQCGSTTLPVTTLPQAIAKDSNTDTEKLIVFDRPFTWTLLDQELGLIFSGSVLSSQTPTTPTSASSTTSPFLFGLENQLAFATCL